MPFIYRIADEQRLIEVNFSGPTSAHDLAEARDRVIADRAYEPRFGLLVDVRLADLTLIDAQHLRQRAQRPPRAGPMAILVSTDFGYGMARMYEQASPGRVAVFRSYHEAVSWLNTPPGEPGER